MGNVFLNYVLPVFAVPAFGYLAGRGRMFSSEAASSINRFVFYVALPALMFSILANAPVERFAWWPLAGFLVSEALVYAAGFAIARGVFRCEMREALLIGMAGGFVNHILFVLPIAIHLFGREASMPIAAIATIDSLFVFGSAIVAMEILAKKSLSWLGVTRKIAANPMMIAMVSGMAVAVAGIELPEGINVYLDFTGGAAAPGALFALGIILSQQGPSRRPWLPVVVTGFKLVVHPLLAWLCVVTLLGIDPLVAKPSLLVAAGPCGTMSFVLALNYGVRLNSIARAILYTTVGSVVTMTIVATL